MGLTTRRRDTLEAEVYNAVKGMSYMMENNFVYKGHSRI